VVFDSVEARSRCLQAAGVFREGPPVVEFVRSILRRVCPAGPRNDYARGLVFLGEHRVQVMPAPEPSDMRWHNFEISPPTIGRRTVITFVAAALLLAVTAALLYWDETLANNSAITMLGGVIIVTIMGEVISYVVPLLAGWERRHTLTGEEQSLFAKLASALVVNDVLLILIASPEPETWFDLDGPMEEAFWICITSSVLGDIARVVLSSNLIVGTESLAELHACLMSTVALALVYGPGMPLVYPITVVTIAIMFASTKYFMLRRAASPPLYSDHVHSLFTSGIALVLLASLRVQYFLLGGSHNPSASWAPAVGAGAVVAYGLVPVRTVSRLWASLFKAKDDTMFHRYVDTNEDASGTRYTERIGLARYVRPDRAPVPALLKPGEKPPPPPLLLCEEADVERAAAMFQQEQAGKQRKFRRPRIRRGRAATSTAASPRSPQNS